MRSLDVYIYHQMVGRLIQDEHGEMAFEYADDWLTGQKAIPLSQSLPLRKERFTRGECRPFFGGILPEGENREVIAKNLGISARNDFAMLEQIGGDCAGAVTFTLPGVGLPQPAERYLPLSDQELAKILRELPRRPLLAGGEDIRLSLAGAQDKIPVHVEQNRISIPLGGAASTHIIKPAIHRFAGMVRNELICMKLANAIGLNAASVELGSVEGMDYLLVERYDRVRIASDKYRRLHQEDFCQALGVVSENKYQSEGGPSLDNCFRMLREVSSVPVVDLTSLLDGVIFNFLIGNMDAHGKNFSLLYVDDPSAVLQIRLAPYYDLLCTAYYPELSNKMAMKIGGEYNSGKVLARNFDRLAEEAGLSKPLVKRRIKQVTELVLAKLPGVTFEHPASIEVANLIQSRCERALTRLV